MRPIRTTEESGRSPSASLWRNGDFLKFWFGETLSVLGTQITNLALPLTAIYAFHASDEQVGVLRFLQLAPYLGLALLFGVWVDRARRRHIMLGANLVRLVLIASIPALFWLDALDLNLLLAIACAIGIASVLFDVSWMSYVPTIVGNPKYYVEASAKLGVGHSAVEVAGPGIAGLLVSALTAPIALLADALSYLVSVISLLTIRTREPRPQPPPAERRVWTELRQGLRWVFGNGVLRWLALTGFCCNFSLIAVWTMFVVHATRDLRLGPTVIGVVFAVASVGGLIGAGISRTVIARFHLGRVYFAAQSLLLLGPTLIVLAAGPRPVMIGMFALSFLLTYLGLGVAGVIIVGLRQTSTPQSMMGRMTAMFRTVLYGGGALGGLCAGLLAGRVGAEGGLAVMAVASAAVITGLVVSPVTRMRELPPATEAL